MNLMKELGQSIISRQGSPSIVLPNGTGANDDWKMVRRIRTGRPSHLNGPEGGGARGERESGEHVVVA